MSESYEIRFAEFLGERAYELLDITEGVGLWISEDGVTETTTSLYESFVNLQESIKQQDAEELLRRELNN